MEEQQDNEIIMSFHPSGWIFAGRLLWSLWLPVLFGLAYLFGIFPYPQNGLNILCLIYFVGIVYWAVKEHYAILIINSQFVSVKRAFSKPGSIEWLAITSCEVLETKHTLTGLFRGSTLSISFFAEQEKAIWTMTFHLSNLERAEAEIAINEIKNRLPKLLARKKTTEFN